MTEKRKLIQKYLQQLQSFVTDPASYRSLLHTDMVQTEFPNKLNPSGQERGLEGCLRAMEAGKKLLSEQNYEIANCFESGNQVCVEVVWKGKMATDAGPLRKGQELRAFLGMVIEFKDGKIYRQRNYDCYEAFK